MRTVILLLIALAAAVVVAGCLGSNTQTAPATITGDASAIDSTVNDLDTGISGVDLTQTELNADVSDADLNLGI